MVVVETVGSDFLATFNEDCVVLDEVEGVLMLLCISSAELNFRDEEAKGSGGRDFSSGGKEVMTSPESSSGSRGIDDTLLCFNTESIVVICSVRWIVQPLLLSYNCKRYT